MAFGNQIALTEALAVMAWAKPQSVTADAELLTGEIDTKYLERVVAYVLLGDYAGGNDGSVSGGFQYATTSGGSYTAVSGKQITTASFTGSALDAQIAVLELRVQDVRDSGRYLKVGITPTNQNMTIGILVLGSTYERPADTYDIAAVKEIIEG